MSMLALNKSTVSRTDIRRASRALDDEFGDLYGAETVSCFWYRQFHGPLQSHSKYKLSDISITIHRVAERYVHN